MFCELVNVLTPCILNTLPIIPNLSTNALVFLVSSFAFLSSVAFLYPADKVTSLVFALANKPFIIWKSSKFLEFVGTVKTWLIKFCNPLGFKKAVLNCWSDIEILYFLAKFLL